MCGPVIRFLPAPDIDLDFEEEMKKVVSPELLLWVRSLDESV